jgi:predicted nucleotidyltransferase
MSVGQADGPVLKRFRAALGELYGDRIERVVLFGSRARGDAHDESDYDIAVFLTEFKDRWQEIDRIIPVVNDILDKDEAFIHALPYRAGAYRDRTPLIGEIPRGHRLVMPEATGISTRRVNT